MARRRNPYRPGTLSYERQRRAELNQRRALSEARALPATRPDTKQRARESARKRKERRQQTPKQIERARERQRQARARQPLRPFLAMDGEGGGTDDLGRQLYLMMVAADALGEEERILHRNGGPLTTA